MKTRTRRLLSSSIVVAALVAALIAAVLLRRHSGPQAARLLPGSEAIVYVDLKDIRRLTAFSGGLPPKYEPDYEEFIRQTGIDFERDLDEVAMAVHMGKAEEGRPAENRYSEVLVGHFNSQKVTAYLRRISRPPESYREVEIFSVPVENRTVRVAILGFDRAAISNVDDPAVIRGMIDRSKHLAMSPRGPMLLARYYPAVPFASLAWVIANLPPGPVDAGAVNPFLQPGGFDILLPGGSTVVGSVRYLGSIHAKGDYLFPTEEQARQFTGQLTMFLKLFQTIEASVPSPGNDPDVKTVFDSIKVEQQKDHAIVSASIPPAFLKKFFSEPMLTLGQEKQTPEASPPAQKPKPHSRAKKP
jgi:hypothetical protein